MISGDVAWKGAAKNPANRWQSLASRFSGGIVDIVHTPKFTLDSSDRFFCIGSCFARNIEEHLLYQGVEVLSKNIIAPREEWPNRPSGIVNKFTVHSMRNELEWVLSPPEYDERLFSEVEDGWVDLQLTPGIFKVSLARAVERRRYLSECYFARISKASVVVLTLGLNEIWYDSARALHLNAPPSYFATRKNPGRYFLKVTDFVENFIELQALHATLKKLNPDARIIVTVSPVPMSETFSGRDIFVANMYSKSMLCAAANAFADAHEDVDYFPSYDIISLSPRQDVYDRDCLHVRNDAVGAMMGLFLRLYMGIDAEPIAFRELPYLNANADVDALVRRGELDSGYAHWIREGQKEGRPLAPGDPVPA
ncbi:GSCFA domain-containing protein [Sphingomonas pokkalii]|uniref:GSCFA domain-containing protein n=1 Tax=Sphingomonas pokkalii TaxID=2175090 RepID=A0A2U0SIN8_9SPHN|nr:GSCFA domain-containing protein [Sphingomonas pokkalii]PVX31183.1 hypothetical protein DD559_19080 [Sphingomonas pokkalii]